MIEELYTRYHTELVKWCLKMTENQRTAEDIVGVLGVLNDLAHTKVI